MTWTPATPVRASGRLFAFVLDVLRAVTRGESGFKDVVRKHMATDLEASRALVLNAARMKDFSATIVASTPDELKTHVKAEIEKEMNRCVQCLRCVRHDGELKLEHG